MASSSSEGPSPPLEASTVAPAAPAPDTAAPAPALALREDQIQNAVAFLTHPKVRESPTSTKRSFLERKGLTAAEIDEAFKRAPEPAAASPSSVTTAPTTTSTGLITYQPQPAAQQQGAVVPAGHVQQQPYQPYQPPGAIVPAQQAAPPPPEPLRWSQVLLGVGVVAAGVYAVKALVFPQLHGWYTSWAEKARAQREAQEKQAAALQEAAEALKACQAELRSSSEAMSSLVASLKEQAAQQAAALQASELSSLRRSDQLLQELSDIRNGLALQAAAPHKPSNSPAPAHKQPSSTAYAEYGQYHGSGAPYGASSNGPASNPRWQSSSRDNGPTYPGGSSTITPPPHGYLGGHPGGHSVGGMPPRGPSYGDMGAAGGSAQQQQVNADYPAAGGARSSPPPPPGGEVPYPPSFHEVMEMVSKGITPPNVKKDIKDTPPDPTRPLPEAAARPAAKPWERAGSSTSVSSSAAPPPARPAAAEFAVQPSFDPSSGFGPGWGLPAGGARSQPPEGSSAPGSSSWQAQAEGAAGPAGAASAREALASAGSAGSNPAGSVYSSIFGGARSSPPPGGPAAAPTYSAPTYPPVSVLGGPNPAWKPPAAPLPTVTYKQQQQQQQQQQAAGGTASGAQSGPLADPPAGDGSAFAAEPSGAAGSESAGDADTVHATAAAAAATAAGDADRAADGADNAGNTGQGSAGEAAAAAAQ